MSVCVESAARLAGPHHGHIQAVERGRVFGHGVGQRLPASTSSRTALMIFLKRAFCGLLLEDVQGAQHGQTRADHGGELAGEDRLVSDA